MVEIKVGTYIVPEKWGIGEKLKPGLAGFCDYYIPTHSGGPIKEIACNVEVTGRKPRWFGGSWWMRVKIIFVGDGEPDTITRGWTPCNYLGENPS
jgi:hypothetical protein